MTLKEKIDSIDYSKIGKPEAIKQFVAKVEEKAKTSMTEAQALMDGILVKIQEKYPDAITKKIAPEKAISVITKLKKLKNIVPRKADYVKVADQIQKQQPKFTRQQAEELAKLRIEAQIARSNSFNEMIDVLSKSSFYSGRLSTAPIDKGRGRDLQKDSNRSSITEADELKMRKKGVNPRKYKRISKSGHKNQYGTTSGGNVYYEYRDNRRDVDSKIRLENGGSLEGRFKKHFNKGGWVLYDEDTQKEIKTYKTESEARKDLYEYEGNGNIVKKSVWDKSIEPKVDRFMFEDEMYEYGKGGGVNCKGKLTGIKFNERHNQLIVGNIIDKKNVPNTKKKQNIYEILRADTLEYFSSASEYLLKTRLLKDSQLYSKDDVSKYALGDVIDDADTPKVWVGEWSLYNEGKLIGEWVDLTRFDSGAEVMQYIQSLLDKWTKETGELREEYGIFDYENFPSSLYSEQMGEDAFDQVLLAYNFSQENDIPMDVVGTIIQEYGADDLEEWFSERYAGQFDSDTDLAYWYVDEMLGGVEQLDKKTQEMYFDYESFGRDLAINDYRDIDGYYFQAYKRGGMTKQSFNGYFKRK